jgi:hypothetical protein
MRRVLILALTLAACGDPAIDDMEKAPSPTQTVAPTPEPTAHLPNAHPSGPLVRTPRACRVVAARQTPARTPHPAGPTEVSRMMIFAAWPLSFPLGPCPECWRGVGDSVWRGDPEQKAFRASTSGPPRFPG